MNVLETYSVMVLGTLALSQNVEHIIHGCLEESRCFPNVREMRHMCLTGRLSQQCTPKKILPLKHDQYCLGPSHYVWMGPACLQVGAASETGGDSSPRMNPLQCGGVTFIIYFYYTWTTGAKKTPLYAHCWMPGFEWIRFTSPAQRVGAAPVVWKRMGHLILMQPL